MPLKMTEDQRQKRIYATARYIECCRRRRELLLIRMGMGTIKPEFPRWIEMYSRRMRRCYLRINRLSNPYERKQSMANTTWLAEKIPMVGLADYWGVSCNDVYRWMRFGAPAWRRGQIHMLRERLEALPKIDLDSLWRTKL